MPEAYAQDFDDDTAFERLLLDRVVPVVPVDVGSASATYDIEEGSMRFAVGLSDTVGLTVSGMVQQLGILPLAFGAAWKVLDLLLEFALPAAGLRPARNSRWTITEKVRHARMGVGQALPISKDTTVWSPILAAYGACEEVRHSLVHRRANVDAAGALVGVDRAGSPLRALTVDEQGAFCRSTQLASAAVIAGALTARHRDELLWELDQLVGITGSVASGTSKPNHPVPVIEVTLPTSGAVDLVALKQKLHTSYPTAKAIDVVFVLSTCGVRVHAYLENVPDVTTVLDPTKLPSWVRLFP